MKIRDIEEVTSFSDLVNIMDYCYSAVQWSDNPDIDWTSRPFSWQMENVDIIKNNFEKGVFTGWCGSCAQFMSVLLRKYGLNTKGYNYGIVSRGITHVALNVELYDKMWLLMDPYFNKYYTYKGEFPLLFEDLIRIVRNNRFDLIEPVYGKSSKVVRQCGEKSLVKPKDFEDTVMAGFCDDLGSLLKEFLNDDNPLSMLPLRI